MRKLLRSLCFVVLLCSCMLALSGGVPGTYAYISTSADLVTNSFKPSYDPDTDTLYLTITVHKTVECISEETIGPEGFSFILENTQTGESITKVSDAKGLAIFPFTFTPEDAGKVFTYQLYELKDGRPGVTYSDQLYSVQISVDMDDEEHVHADILLNDFPTAIAPFRNVYNAKEDPTLPDTGDHAQPVLYAGMIFAGGVGCLLLKPARKRR